MCIDRGSAEQGFLNNRFSVSKPSKALRWERWTISTTANRTPERLLTYAKATCQRLLNHVKRR